MMAPQQQSQGLEPLMVQVEQAPRQGVGEPSVPASQLAPIINVSIPTMNKEDFGRDKDLKNLLKNLKPKAFSGKGIENEVKLEEWIIAMEDYFDLAKYNEIAKEIFAQDKLEGPARTWWKKSL